MADLEQIPIDPIAQKFTGGDHKALAEALALAYPNPNLLDQMLTARLDQPLNAITAPYPLSQATFDVVTFYKAKGHLLRLIAAARASQPDNAALAVVGERFHMATPTRSQPELEKIVKKTSVPFPVAIWRERLGKRMVCVCRVEVPTNNGMSFGSGFLVGPDLVLISAGFDAHREDPLAQIELTEADFTWVTEELMEMAEKHAGPRSSKR